MKEIIMDSKTKILIIILIVGVLIVGWQIWNNWNETKVELPIDSQKEAIIYAKSDFYKKIFGLRISHFYLSDINNNLYSLK